MIPTPPKKTLFSWFRSSPGRLWKAGLACLLLLVVFALAGSAFYAFEIEPA